MSHHKRCKRKNARAGCLMCKPHKMNGWNKDRAEVLHRGFGKIRAKAHAIQDQKDGEKDE